MAYDVVFYASNAIALAGWTLLIGFPHTRAAAWVRQTMAPSIAIATLYAGLVLTTFIAGGSDGNFFTLDGVKRLFDDRGVLTAAWIHYLAFDLAIGCWMSRRARELPLAHRWLVPCLALTLWLGPVGFLLFTVLTRRHRLNA